MFGFKALGEEGPEAEARVDAMIERFGFDADAEPYLLNRGTRQLLALASIIVLAPPTIILDEPTVGLDPAQVIEIRKLIRELGRAHTVILSSHILSEVQAVCQQILILSKGHLAAAGSLEELTADGKSLEEVFLELTDGESEEATGEEDAE